MKLQLKLGKNIERIDLSNSEKTLRSLNEGAANCFRLPAGTFYVSLNGKDELKADDENTLLSLFDIVSGDRIFVVERDKSKREKAAKEKCKTVTSENSETRSSSNPSGTRSSSNPSGTGSSSNPSGTGSSSNPSGTGSLSNPSGAGSASTTEENMITDEDKSSVKVEGHFECISSEPMVVRDSTDDRLPLALRSLFEREMPQDAHETLVLICHILLLETGFNVESTNGTDSAKIDATSLLAARNKGAYTLTYSHDYCEQATMTMVCVPMSSMLVVHGKLTGVSGAVTPLQFRSADYIGQVVQGYPSTWHQLSSLSRIFKDNFAHSILAAMRQKLNLPVLYGFLALMPEIQLKILSFLNMRELTTLSTVCKHLRSLANDGALWRRLVLKDFNLRKSSSASWKNTYVKNYRHKLEMERRRRMRMPDSPNQSMPPRFGLVPQYPQPFPNAFPGIRGGDYDLHPFSQAPSSLFNPRGIGSLPNAGPVPGARFDPINPFRDPSQRPGRGGGLRDNNLHSRLNFGGGFF